MDLFRLADNRLAPVARVVPRLERDVQRLLEANLETVFRVTFLASEYSTGEKHGGRIDTLGIDENQAPVIIEYKLTPSANVITQALYYLEWLVDHKAEFEQLVSRRLGREADVDWTEPRVLCVADGFALHDAHAVALMGRAIQLVEYKLFADGLLIVQVVGDGTPGKVVGKPSYSVAQHIGRAKGTVRALAEQIRRHLLGLGEDVSESPHKQYIAYRTTRNICCLEVHQEHLLLYLALDPSQGSDCGICRNVTTIGHYGTGNLEVRVQERDDVAIAAHLIDLAYEHTSDAGGSLWPSGSH
jgi:predicted transport protein